MPKKKFKNQKGKKLSTAELMLNQLDLIDRLELSHREMVNDNIRLLNENWELKRRLMEIKRLLKSD